MEIEFPFIISIIKMWYSCIAVVYCGKREKFIISYSLEFIHENVDYLINT